MINLNVGDLVAICHDGIPFMHDQKVVKIGYKWIHVTFGCEAATRRFTLEGHAKMSNRFTIIKEDVSH